ATKSSDTNITIAQFRVRILLIPLFGLIKSSVSSCIQSSIYYCWNGIQNQYVLIMTYDYHKQQK
ncbi:MAG TPA: hypothetical protein VKA91_09425, partial [Nitrososphaeraceae archaeon]|nr:hypothetical protein [Nitrososphaeraceae archaeon]